MTVTQPLTKAQAALIDEYVMFLQACSASPRTVLARKRFAAARLREWGMDGLTRANALAYCSNLTELLGEDEVTEWTVSTYHSHLRSFGQWVEFAGYSETDMTNGIPKPRRPRSVPNPLSDAEVDRVLSVAAGDVRDWLLLGMYAGLRAHEMGKVRGEHVRRDGLYVRGKGGIKAVIPMHPALTRMAERREDQGQGFWFPGSDHGHISGQRVSAKIGALFDALGINGSSHRCRHYYGTSLARQGVHITKIKELMRHASLATTQGYIQIVESELRDAVHLLPDRDVAPLL